MGKDSLSENNSRSKKLKSHQEQAQQNKFSASELVSKADENQSKNQEIIKQKSTRPITLKDAKQFGTLISNIETGTQQLERSVENLMQKARELSTENGMSILDSKNKLLRSYLINLLFYISQKVKGRSVEDHPVISRLLYLKTMLEKLRPLQSKTAYQVQKAIQASTIQSTSQKSAFKPRPSQIDLEEEDEQDEQEKEEQSSDQQPLVPKYKAPLLNPTLSNKEIVKERKKKAASRKNIARSALMQEIRQEILDLPEEVFDEEDKGKKLLDEEKQIEDFKAQHFKRVSLTKEHKIKIQKKRKEVREQQRALQNFDQLGLGDITAALNQRNVEDDHIAGQKNFSQLFQRNSQLKQRKKNPMDQEITSSEEDDVQEMQNKRQIVFRRDSKKQGGNQQMRRNEKRRKIKKQ